MFNEKIHVLKNLMTKLRAIHRSCYYKKAEMDDIFKTFCSEEKWKQLLTHDKNYSDFDWDSVDCKRDSSAPKVIRSNSTRWNTSLFMLRSIIPLVDILNRIQCDAQKMNLLINHDELKLIKELVDILELFEEAVKVCQVCVIV